MARRAFWPTVETSEATIFARGVVTAPVCDLAEQNCCAPDSTSLCCPNGFTDQLLFAASGPLGPEFATTVLSYDLNYNADASLWIGGDEGANGEAIALQMTCVEDPEFGTLWVISGSYYAVEIGVYLPFSVVTPVTGDALIAVEIEVPGSDTPISLVIDHPCPDEVGTGTAGTGTEAGTSTSTAAGGTDACGCTGIPDNLYAHFAGSVAGLGTIALTYLSGTTWRGTLPDVLCCPGGASFVDFSCVSGSWQITTAHPALTFTGTETIETCAPFSVELGGSSSGPFCTGLFTVTVDTTP